MPGRSANSLAFDERPISSIARAKDRNSAGVGGGTSALAQHVEGIARLLVRLRALQRLGDGLAMHEMRSEQPHGLSRCQPHRRQAETLVRLSRMPSGVWPGVIEPRGDTERQNQAETRRCRRDGRDVTSRAPPACPRSGGQLSLHRAR